MEMPETFKQFAKYSYEKVAFQLSSQGKYTIDSEADSVGYVIHNDHIFVIAGRGGMLAIELKKVEGFAEELLQMKKLADERKQMGIRGA